MDGKNSSNFLQSCNVFQVNNERPPDSSNLFISLQTPLTAAHFILVQGASSHHEYPSATFSLITGLSAAPPS